MSTTKTTKFYVQMQLTEGGGWITSGLDSHDTYEDAVLAVGRASDHRPNAHAFRITRETTATSFTAYQPITSRI